MPTNADPASYATTLEAMTDDEVFIEMRKLEQKSEVNSKNRGTGLEDILGKIALVETQIEQRFPGQALAPYKQWLRNQGA